MRYIQGIDRKKSLAFPGCIDSYISEDNPVRVIDEFVKSLNIEELGFKNAVPSELGRYGFDPRDMLRLYIYGYMNGITSSRGLEKEATRNMELMWLLRMIKPDFKPIADFRKDNKGPLQEVFRQFIALCKQWDLFGMEVVAIDGSKFRACNSKKNNFNKKNLSRRIKYIDEKIEKYMTETDENDASEESSRKPSAEEIREKVRELKRRKETYEAYKAEIEEKDVSEISTTDSDARLMAVNNNGVDVCYNVQTAVDSKHSLVVDCNVINNPTDHGQLSKMGMRAKEVFGVESIKALADKGYYNADDLKECERESITTYVSKQVFSNSTGEREFYADQFRYDRENDVYICPKGQELECTRKKAVDENTKSLKYSNSKACSECMFKDKCTKSKRGRVVARSLDQDFLDTVDERTKENKDLYKTRQMIVEHPFGTIKRGWGLSYFLTKGIESVKTEVSLAFLVYNIKRVTNILGIKEISKRLKEFSYSFNLSDIHIYIYWATGSGRHMRL